MNGRILGNPLFAAAEQHRKARRTGLLGCLFARVTIM